MELLFGLAQGLLGHFQPPGGAGVGRLGLGHRRLQLMARLLGLGQALAQLVVLAFEERGAALGGGQPGPQLVEGPPIPLEGMVEGGDLAPGHGDRLFGLSELGPVPPCLEMDLELGGGRPLGGDDRLLPPAPATAASAPADSSSAASRAPSASSVETTSASAAASSAWASDRWRSRSTPESPRARSTSPSARPRAEARSDSALCRHLVGGPLGVGVELAERFPQPLLRGPQFGRAPAPSACRKSRAWSSDPAT